VEYYAKRATAEEITNGRIYTSEAVADIVGMLSAREGRDVREEPDVPWS
jgi:hypothetical protein